MNQFWQSIKEGSIDGVGVFGAAVMTLIGVVIVSFTILAFWILYWFDESKNQHSTKQSDIPIHLSFSMICEAYVYWHKTITTAIKNLVK